jgi:integrase
MLTSSIASPGSQYVVGLKAVNCDTSEVLVEVQEQVLDIIAEAEPPYDLCLQLIFETGIRRGEVCALDVRHISLEGSAILVRFSRSGSKIKLTKSRKPRLFSLSPQLIEKLRAHIEGRSPEEPLFLSKEGKRLLPDNFGKRILKPILQKLGLVGGFHALRHGNATALDGLCAPMAVRQARLGHMEQETTLKYTHLISEDDRRVSRQLGDLIEGKKSATSHLILDPIGPNNKERQVVGLP